MSKLYREFAQRPEKTELPTLFGKLGIISQPDGTVRFDDAAELAAARRRITTDQ